MFATLISVSASLAISLMLTPAVIKLAARLGVVASPNHRTVHKNCTPKLGGLGIFFAFAVGLLIFASFTKNPNQVWGLLAGGGAVLLLGLCDDIHGISCYRKLAGQTIAAIIAVYFGYKVDSIFLPFGLSLKLGYWALPMSVVWIVGITNAVNLLDGLDGLAAGFSIVVSFFVLLGAVMLQNYETAAVAFILIAASLGFLKYNFAPAKIFLGDTGSLFLGFILACLSFKAFHSPATGVALSVPMALLLLPIADTALAILRRLSRGRHPFEADKEHIHHRLLELGLSQTSAVLILYSASFICGVIGMTLLVVDTERSWLILTGLWLSLMLALNLLGCFGFLSRKEYASGLSSNRSD